MNLVRLAISSLIVVACTMYAVADTKGGGTVFGRVYDEVSGKGFSGVAVRAYGHNWNPDKLTRTNSDGSYRLEDLQFGIQKVVLLAPVDEREERPSHLIGVHDGKTVRGVDFAVKNASLMRGVVKTLDGKPVPDAIVRADRGSEEVATAADGSFAMLHPKRDEYGVYARKPGFAESLRTVVTVGVEHVELVLEPGGSVSGVVVDSAGEPVEGACVSALGGGVCPVLTGRDGRFHLGREFEHEKSDLTLPGNMREGRYILNVSCELSAGMMGDKPGGSPSAVEIPVELRRGQDLTGVKVVLKEVPIYPSISGHVVDETGKPLADVRVSAYGTELDPILYTVSGPEGEFRISRLTEGKSFQIRAGGKGLLNGIVERVSAGTKDLRVVCRRCGAIRLKVADEKGRSISKFLYSDRCTRMEEDLEEERLLAEQGTLPADINFVFKSAPDGILEIKPHHASNELVWIKAPGYAPNSMRIPTPEGGAVQEATIVLKKSAIIRGKVVDANGNPVPYAAVFAGPIPPYIRQHPTEKHTTASPECVADTIADPQGKFLLDIVPDGCAVVSACCEGQLGEQPTASKTGKTSSVEIELKN